jgi:5-methylcytosine-specific restriction endonuclease McrA
MKTIEKICETCGKTIKVRFNKHGDVYVQDKNKRFCSLKCLNDWQKSTIWENIIGEECADRIRKERSEQVKGDKNPSKNKDVAEKISKSMKIFLLENPRIGDKNPFYGKHHSDEYKKNSSESKKGKWSYNEDQYIKLCDNTPKGENHPNYQGGISNGEYPFLFNEELKNKIKIRDEYKCQICGKKKLKLAIHHIDYIKENLDENNLITLCVSCHSKTNYNREEWIEFFKNK